MARLGATASKPWKSSATIKLTHCPLAINPTDAVAVGNRRSRTGVECRRHRRVGHRPASRRSARARPEVPRPRTGSPPLRSQSGDRLAVVVSRPCAWPRTTRRVRRSRTSQSRGRSAYRCSSAPEALLQVLTNNLYRFKRVGLEAGPLSQWLLSALAEVGLPMICVEMFDPEWPIRESGHREHASICQLVRKRTSQTLWEAPQSEKPENTPSHHGTIS